MARDTGTDARRVNEVFDQVVDLAPEARAAYLDEACRGEPLIRREVESLLASLEGVRTEVLFPPLLIEDEAQTLAIGERVGPYTLRREIGQGGMGVVYEARREDVDKRVALKLVRHGRLASPEHLRRFLLERRVLARLEHPNIARLLDAGVTESDLPYLVMEFVAGVPIDAYADVRRLTIEERLALFVRVCDAVDYAHRHLVVHRDLKPSNILVDGDGTVKLLDFGIAALLEDDASGAGRLTRTGLVMLTPEYAAPEQVKGEPVTTASDVYALGLLLFELLTGQRPLHLESRTPPEILRAVCEEEPPPPSDAVRRGRVVSRGGRSTAAALQPAASARRTTPARLARRLAGDLDTIVLTALKKEPERRYHSALALREDIERHLAGLPVRARGDSLWYRARKFVQRRRGLVTAVVLLVLSLAAGMIATLVQARRAHAARAIAEQRFHDVRALAGELVSDVYDAIDDIPGSLPVRATLVTRAVEHLDRLYRQAGDDPVLRREIAAAYVNLGLVQGNPTVANLGDLAAARASFERALSIAGTLVAADSNDRAARRTIALAHEKLSDAEAWSGRLAEGVEHARHALAQWGVLAASAPASVSAQRAVATSHVKLGDLLGNPNLPSLADRAGAAGEYQRALTLLRAVPPDSLADWNTRRLLALVHERIGSLLHLSGRDREAIAEFAQTLTVREALVRERSTSVNAQRDVAVTHQILAEAQLAAGETAPALANARRAVELYESLRAADPRNAQSVHDVAVGLLSVQKVLAARGDASGALAQLQRSTGLLREILAAQADNVAAKRDLARGLLYASALHAALAARADVGGEARGAHRDQARSSYDEGARLLAELGARAPATPEDSALVAKARAALSRGQTPRT